MRWDGDEEDGDPGPGQTTAGRKLPPLTALPGSGQGGAERALSVRLLREYKGPTVADLLRDEDLAVALPGQVRRAAAEIQRGDLAAAEAALPGHLPRVLPGPRPRVRRRRHLLLLLLCLTLVVAVLGVLVVS